MKTISVIIPMYNTEAFIKQCIQSVLNQTYQMFEIIVVDDGSTDKGAQICREMAEKDNRIHLHCRGKQGVSAARNYALDMAKGEYIFFLDSDDVIHPLLFEEMLCKMGEFDAGMAFCAYEKVDSRQLEVLLDKVSCNDEKPWWQMIEGAETEKWFHQKYAEVMSAIGGKMLRAGLLEEVRFDEDLSNGEDTLFLYHLVSSQIRAVFSPQKWYFYRMHAESIIHSCTTILGKRYFEADRKIRDMEFHKGRCAYALKWEGMAISKIRRSYLEQKRAGNISSCRRLRKIAKLERKHPLYLQISFVDRLLFISCFYCSFLFHVLRKLLFIKRILKRKILPQKTDAKVGILTFHCADNFGAMLQTYGLKTCLCRKGIEADVIRYDPPFMTGRHWLIPYVPGNCNRGIRGFVRSGKNTVRRWKENLKMGNDFSVRRKNMRCFREKYLVNKVNSRMLFTSRFKMLTYPCYIVGSDQIWNPDITLGIRKAYFGAFKNKKKEKVISYAASFGGASLPQQYDEDFSRLIQNVDAVSVREEEAIPYVEKFYKGKVTAVLDPVFFLKKEVWQQVEKLPEDRGYILVYVTERNQALSQYVQKLSEEKKLSVIEVSVGNLVTGAGFPVDYTAGPSEFLGYIHQADYVVTNSFHAVAFSIIYHKKFLAFTHSNRGARLQNVLKIHGLKSRLCQTGTGIQIDDAVDWDLVERRREENVRKSGNFLIENILDGSK